MPWPLRVLRGSWAARSLTARARCIAEDSAETAGAPLTKRSQAPPQSGQGAGSRHCDKGLSTENSPQSSGFFSRMKDFFESFGER